MTKQVFIDPVYYRVGEGEGQLSAWMHVSNKEDSAKDYAQHCGYHEYAWQVEVALQEAIRNAQSAFRFAGLVPVTSKIVRRKEKV